MNRSTHASRNYESFGSFDASVVVAVKVLEAIDRVCWAAVATLMMLSHRNAEGGQRRLPLLVDDDLMGYHRRANIADYWARDVVETLISTTSAACHCVISQYM